MRLLVVVIISQAQAGYNEDDKKEGQKWLQLMLHLFLLHKEKLSVNVFFLLI